MNFGIPLTYRNVLPRLWYLMLIKDDFFKKSEGVYYQFGGVTKKQLGHILSKMGGTPDDGAQKLHKDVCSYCGEPYTFARKGDHIVKAEIHKKYLELDNLLFRINCCKSCNSSKLNKDMLEWWINHKGKNITELSKNHLNIYSRAMWKYCELSNKLDEDVPEVFQKAILQLHDHISESSYDKIWQTETSDSELF